MELGFLTSNFSASLRDKFIFASENEFSTLELIVGTNEGELLVEELNNPSYLEKLNLQIKELDLQIGALAYYHNILGKPSELLYKSSTIKKIITAADYFNCPIVSLFIGRDLNLSIEENFKLMKTVFKPLVEYAEEKNINIIIENCPMPSWHPSGYPSTLSYSPEFWREMFNLIPNQNFGLNFDPSHLAWQQIDYLHTFREFSDRIFSIHAKDILIDQSNLKEYGIFGKQIERKHPMDFGWYSPKPVGEGIIQWDNLLSIASDVKFDGNIIVEYKGENLDKSLASLINSKNYLKALLERKR